MSPSTLAELAEVVQRPHIAKKYPLNESDITSHLDVLRNFAEVAPGALALDVVPADPKDNQVLAAAVETGCAHIVSGDHHLLDMGKYRSIHIHTPREFLTLLEAVDQPPDDSSA